MRAARPVRSSPSALVLACAHLAGRSRSARGRFSGPGRNVKQRLCFVPLSAGGDAMPIEVDKVIGAQIPGAVAEWDEDSVILYHLGVGAGVPATDPAELQYTYESSPLKVLPSF